jgi:uncharacterized membrane protein YkvA (DUF1232 family)
MGLHAAWQRWFERKRRRAERLVHDLPATARTADRAERKARRRRGPLARVWDDLQTLVRLVRAWARREYRDVSPSSLVMIVGALVYLVSPIDAILDAIPFIGLIDDAAVIGWVVGQVRAELEAFRSWEAGRAAPPAIAAAQG